VLTVVLKLFNLVQPKRAYFGQKDFQQVVLIRQMVRDLALPLRIVVVPTVRDQDGLAMSSRNAYLDVAQRRLAPEIHRALLAAASAFAAGLTIPTELEDTARRMLVEHPEIQIDYLSVVDATTLSTPEQVMPGNVLVVAVKLGSTRLIDNVVFGADRI
jgi:pantoate--beta-alanine ligase